MTAEDLAALHGCAFEHGWSADAFRGFATDPACILISRTEGFILARLVLDEAEILTVVVQPEHRRTGVAQALLDELCHRLKTRGACQLFLEVAEDNAAARALYETAGFQTVGRRKGYYPRQAMRAADALILRKDVL